MNQNAEARFYGLLLAVCSLGIFHYDSICRRENCPPILILAGAFIHALIVHTHVFGFLYSGAILVAFIIRDLYLQVLRPKIYLSVVTGWFSFIPWIGPFLNQADLGQPRSWIPTPTIFDTGSHHGDFSLINILTPRREVFLIFIVIGVAILARSTWELRRHGGDQRQSTQRPQAEFKNRMAESSLLILAYCFLAVPVLVWFFSYILEPIFVTRYMIATQLSWAILLAFWIERILKIETWLISGVGALINFARLLLMILIVTLLLVPIHGAFRLQREQSPGLYDDKYGYSELPFVIEFSHQFLQRFQYSPNRDRYFFILDWEAALDNKSGLFSPGEYKTMDALRRNYPFIFADNIVESERFLGEHSRFLVLNYNANCTPHDIACPRWFELRIESNPIYQSKKIGTADRMDLLLVEANIE